MGRGRRVKQVKFDSFTALKNAATVVFRKNPTVDLNYRQLARKLNINNGVERELVKKVLYALEKDKVVFSDGRGKYRMGESKTLVTGTIVFSATGRAWILPEGANKDIPVRKGRTANALSGDLVEAKYMRQNRRIWLVVTRVVKRSERQYTGTAMRLSGRCWIMPDDLKTGVERFFVDKGPKEGERVVFSLKRWRHGQKYPDAEIIELLGTAGSEKAENEAIIYQYGLPMSFPDEVLSLAGKRCVPVQTNDKKRVDFREIPTFTIDPEDAKDFDDAISIRQTPKGLEVGVHIADVSHYVKSGDAIDREALARSTSVYLVDRVIPMLPEILCNDRCSLKPGETRYCFSVVFVFDKDYKICEKRICKGLINSDKRFSYAEAMNVLEKGKGSMAKELAALRLLCRQLRKKRMEHGAFDFSSNAFQFIRNTNGEIVHIRPKQLLETNSMVEEMMLLANKAVAETLTEYCKRMGGDRLAVYRVHDKPDSEKVSQLVAMSGILGYRVDAATPDIFRKSLNKAIREAAASDQGESRMIGLMAIRSMAKACYSTDNIGHYGLGFDYYTHFTSPIRRYPDLIVHRLLERTLDNNAHAPEGNAQLPVICSHCSEMERKAESAERDSVKVNQLILLEKQVGTAVDGLVTGLSQNGLFVELVDFGCDGFLPIKSIDDDYYRPDEAKLSLTGQRHGRIIRFGDKVRVIINAVNPMTRQLDLRFDEL